MAGCLALHKSMCRSKPWNAHSLARERLHVRHGADYSCAWLQVMIGLDIGGGGRMSEPSPPTQLLGPAWQQGAASQDSTAGQGFAAGAGTAAVAQQQMGAYLDSMWRQTTV